MIAEVVQTETADKLLLTGLLVKGDKSNPAIIHIHGYEGDFFTNKFIHLIAEAVEKKGNAFLSIQHRGTGIRTEFYTATGSRIIGGDYELIEEAHLDISAWIKFLLALGYKQIILQGHSLGTFKAVRYLFEGEYKDKIKKLVLLSVFDKNWMLIDAAGSKANLEKQYADAINKVKAGRGDELAPKGYDSTSHSYANFASWANPDDFGRMFDFYDHDYQFPALRRINVPVKIIVPAEDEYFHPLHQKEKQGVIDILQANIPVAEGKIIAKAMHSFNGYEDIVAKEVAAFV